MSSRSSFALPDGRTIHITEHGDIKERRESTIGQLKLPDGRVITHSSKIDQSTPQSRTKRVRRREVRELREKIKKLLGKDKTNAPNS